MQPSPLLPLASGLLAASIWGGMYVVSKVVLAVIPPFGLLSLRLILGAATLGLWWWFQRPRPPAIPARTWVLLAWIGALGYGLSLGFQFVGTKLSTASNGALVTSATPVVVFLVAALLYREAMGWRRWVALVFAALGVLAVLDPTAIDLNPDLFWGNLCLIGAAVTWALYSVLIGRVGLDLPLVPVTLIALLGGLPFTLAGGTWELGQAPWGPIDGGIVAGVLFLGVISTAVAMAAWNYAFARLPASTASLTFFAQPLVGSLLGWLVLGETLAPLVWVGALALAAGLVLAALDSDSGTGSSSSHGRETKASRSTSSLGS